MDEFLGHFHNINHIIAIVVWYHNTMCFSTSPLPLPKDAYKITMSNRACSTRFHCSLHIFQITLSPHAMHVVWCINQQLSLNKVFQWTGEQQQWHGKHFPHSSIHRQKKVLIFFSFCVRRRHQSIYRYTHTVRVEFNVCGIQFVYTFFMTVKSYGCLVVGIARMIRPLENILYGMCAMKIGMYIRREQCARGDRTEQRIRIFVCRWKPVVFKTFPK